MSSLPPAKALLHSQLTGTSAAAQDSKADAADQDIILSTGLRVFIDEVLSLDNTGIQMKIRVLRVLVHSCNVLCLYVMYTIMYLTCRPVDSI